MPDTVSTYTTQSGDIWDDIAYRQLGGERYTSLLMEANTQHLETVIFPAGVVLNLPEITVPIPEKLPPWKR